MIDRVSQSNRVEAFIDHLPQELQDEAANLFEQQYIMGEEWAAKQMVRAANDVLLYDEAVIQPRSEPEGSAAE